jgi:hypothetical protein
MNPFKIDKSIFSFYSLAYNSFTPLESLEQNTNFIISTKAFPLNVNVGLPNNMPINTGPVQLYINTYQYVVIQVITNYQIPINYCLSINIPSSYIIQGSAYAVLSTVTNNFLIYNYTADTIYISNFGALPGGTVFSVSLKVKFLIQTFSISAKID